MSRAWWVLITAHFEGEHLPEVNTTAGIVGDVWVNRVPRNLSRCSVGFLRTGGVGGVFFLPWEVENGGIPLKSIPTIGEIHFWLPWLRDQVVATQIFFMFTPILRGRWTQFDGCIFFKGVGSTLGIQSPKTSDDDDWVEKKSPPRSCKVFCRFHENPFAVKVSQDLLGEDHQTNTWTSSWNKIGRHSNNQLPATSKLKLLKDLTHLCVVLYVSQKGHTSYTVNTHVLFTLIILRFGLVSYIYSSYKCVDSSLGWGFPTRSKPLRSDRADSSCAPVGGHIIKDDQSDRQTSFGKLGIAKTDQISLEPHKRSIKCAIIWIIVFISHSHVEYNSCEFK